MTIFNFQFSIFKGAQRGFTLIELLLVFFFIGMVTSLGVASFVNYSRSQALQQAANDVVSMITLAKNRTLYQVTPCQVNPAQPLSGYKFVLCFSGQCIGPSKTDFDYEVDALCGGNAVFVQSKKLPPKISFDQVKTTSSTLFFPILRVGGVQSGTISLTGYSLSKEIQIDYNGNIQLSQVFTTPAPTRIPTPTPTPTPTPIPTSTPTPLPTKRVFVTSDTYNGDLKKEGKGRDGLDGGDKLCQGRAKAGNLGGTWKAWLSTRFTNVNAKDRIGDFQYSRLDNKIIATSKPDLLDGTISNPVNVDENKNTVGSPNVVWTGTKADGMFADGGSSACEDWTTASFGSSAVGESTAVDSSWTIAGGGGCFGSARLYCFEQ